MSCRSTIRSSWPTPARYMNGLESPADGKNIVRGLIARGYSDEDVRKIAGGKCAGVFQAGDGVREFTVATLVEFVTAVDTLETIRL